MDALADTPTTRLATPDCEPITTDRIDTAIHKTFPDVHTRIEEWTTAHADLNWANITGPHLQILDWEDWGQAPRGLDAATLWFASLTTPEIAAKIRHHRHTDLNSPTGRTIMLFRCAELLTWADPSEPLYTPATREAEELITSLR
jgi:hypothetical protein